LQKSNGKAEKKHWKEKNKLKRMIMEEDENKKNKNR
jgi:hypothetical protein